MSDDGDRAVNLGRKLDEGQDRIRRGLIDQGLEPAAAKTLAAEARGRLLVDAEGNVQALNWIRTGLYRDTPDAPLSDLIGELYRKAPPAAKPREALVESIRAAKLRSGIYS